MLGGLPEAQRGLIVLRDLQGLSYQQIADVLGCSVSSVKLRLFRARRGFKERDTPRAVMPSPHPKSKTSAPSIEV